MMAYRSPPPHRRSSGSTGNKLTHKSGKSNKYTPKTNTQALEVAPREVTETVMRALVESFDGRVLTWEAATAGLADAAFQIKQMALAEIGKR